MRDVSSEVKAKMKAMILDWPWAKGPRDPAAAGRTAQGTRAWPLAALAAIVVLAGALRFYNLSSLGYANQYYTAGVKAMLASWHNFFFVAAEPGGSVSLDKPPVGFWLQAASAAVFGVNTFGVLLPELLSGMLSVVVLYHLVQRRSGQLAGLTAALALAIAPVAVATDRNNTIDSSLILALLLAAWAFVKATESGRLKYLLLGAGLVGIGFNIKMLEAFLPLPAFYALYLLGAPERLARKAGKVALATLLLLAISLSWITAVDLTPASQRPYVGSSGTNSAWNLAIGYNGVQRLLGMGPGPNPSGGNLATTLSSLWRGSGSLSSALSNLWHGSSSSSAEFGLGMPPGGGAQPVPWAANGIFQQLAEANAANGGATNAGAGAAGNGAFQRLAEANGGAINAAAGGAAGAAYGAAGNGAFQRLAPANVANGGTAGAARQGPPDGGGGFGGGGFGGGPGGPGGGGPGGGGMFGTGQAGPLRLLTGQLSNEIGWLLPFGFLAGLLLLLRARLRWPIQAKHQSAVLWGGWLLTEAVFFSVAGFFHPYYLSMLAAPLAALAGLGVAELWQMHQERWRLALGLTAAVVACTVAVQLNIALNFVKTIWWLPIVAGLFGAGIVLSALARRHLEQVSRLGFGCLVAAMLVTPGIWSGLTTLYSTDSLPSAYSGQQGGPGGGGPGSGGGLQVDQALLSYLQAHTQGVKYLLAVSSSNDGAGYVLATGRPVLYLGGFGGSDQVETPGSMAQLVAGGQLRYVSLGGMGGGPGGGQADVTNWVTTNCKVVQYEAASQSTGSQAFFRGPGGGPGWGQNSLYECGA